ncbi:MAG: hypothetical protein JZU65_03210, partial [Chlorobium sp.]|nr:hypothetical protein [Chlorobium sp.]
IVTISGFSSFHSVLSSDKNLIVAVMTNNDGSVALSLSVRTGGTAFSLANMQGAWKTNYLMLNQYKWGRATTTLDVSGNAVITNTMQSDGIKPEISLIFPSITTGGIFGSSSGDWASNFSGVMSLNKNLMIGTVTQDTTGTPSPSLFVWVK